MKDEEDEGGGVDDTRHFHIMFFNWLRKRKSSSFSCSQDLRRPWLLVEEAIFLLSC